MIRIECFALNTSSDDSLGAGGQAVCRSSVRAARLVPRLKHENGPQLALAVSMSGQMLLPHLIDPGRLEPAAGGQLPWVEQIGGPGAKRSPQPLADRHAETHLPAVGQGRRHVSIEDLAEDRLAAAVAMLELEGELPGKLDQPMIQQRDARFQADGHRRPIDLGQNVVGQIGHQVEIHRLFEYVSTGVPIARAG